MLLFSNIASTVGRRAYATKTKCQNGVSALHNQIKMPCRFQSVVSANTSNASRLTRSSRIATATRTPPNNVIIIRKQHTNSSSNASVATLSKLIGDDWANYNYSRTIDTSIPAILAATAMFMNMFLNNTNNSDTNHHNNTQCLAHPSPTPVGVGAEEHFEDHVDKIDTLPTYTSAQVAENDGKDGKPTWMSYGGVVYDVTNFIHNHPGGSERILLAAGSSVEQYWHIYRQHFASDLPMRLMENMIIGHLDEKDQEKIDAQMEKIMDENDDPYLHEPVRSDRLIVHSDQPMNAEVPYENITDSYITPVELFYIRHHHPVPLLLKDDLEKFRLEVDVTAFVDALNQNKTKKSSSSIPMLRKLSLNDIKKLPKVEVTTTLQCSGNRRGDMNGVQRTSGTSWGQGAVSTAKWSGARLVDVLKLAGVDDPYDLTNKDGTQKHVRFESIDGMKASINMEKATNPYGDVIIAYEMNDEPIPRDHGFPLRAIVPGYSAVRNVKWVNKIELSHEEAEGAWQRGLNYKVIPPNITDVKNVDLNVTPGMTESSLFSGITKIEVEKSGSGKSKKRGTVSVKVKGWAWAGK
mmetsp:Transcript_32527/g.37890  ORF Transcript_32527/g.37890 Transcript_32527/m.37890 type:complete len:578 (+) Transcript_32527:121-1854(+)